VRVLQLLWSGNIGGIERQVAAVTRHGAAQGAGEFHACFLDGRGVVGDALVAEALADRLRLRRGWDPIGLYRLGRLLRRQRPDVIHSHTHAVLATLVARIALPRATFVYTEQSPRVLTSDRKFRLLYLVLRRSVSRFVALTPTMARAMEAYGAERSRTVIIPNMFAIPPRTVAGDRRPTGTIGIVARLEPQKRVDTMIEVVAELRRRGIECTGLVVGRGTQLHALVEQTARLGLRDVLEFAGEQDDIVPWLDRMDVFLMTSAAEPFGITALEAMARGVPVVAMPCPGGLSDLIARGGQLLPDRAIGTAADAVAGLLASADRRQELQAKGHATVAAHTADRLFPQLLDLYREVLREASTPSSTKSAPPDGGMQSRGAGAGHDEQQGQHGDAIPQPPYEQRMGKGIREN
jgi:glycosyltransferase involved in cell wall biosynthesis